MIVNFEDQAERAQYIGRTAATKTPIYRKVPAGCGQQGRHDEREWRAQFEDTVPVAPQAAEACTDIGANDTAPQAAAVFWTAYIALVVVGAIAAAAALL